MNAFEELKWREIIHSFTEGTDAFLSKEKKVAVYIGFDPTASSLHVGSLLQIMALVHMQRFGYTPLAIVGGGTGLIGDPSGKDSERPMLTKEILYENLNAIKTQLSNFLDFENKTNRAKVLNNADWLCKLNYLDFLRDIGKHITINQMLSKESVKRRLQSENGISFTEFNYMLLQGYDFLHLFKEHNCVLQMGGSDQWGNIVAGIDFIKKKVGGKAYGIVTPLVQTATGKKFGKTETGNIWLDPALTSPFKFYQFWFNTDDKNAIQYLKYFTALSKEEINEYKSQLLNYPEKREAQIKLADEITKITHGENELEKAQKATNILFGGKIVDLNAKDILDIFSDVPSIDLPESNFKNEGYPIIDLLLKCKMTFSKREARTLIQSGGIYFQNNRIVDPNKKVLFSESIDGDIFVLRKGGKKYHLIKIIH